MTFPKQNEKLRVSILFLYACKTLICLFRFNHKKNMYQCMHFHFRIERGGRDWEPKSPWQWSLFQRRATRTSRYSAIHGANTEHHLIEAGRQETRCQTARRCGCKDNTYLRLILDRGMAIMESILYRIGSCFSDDE